MQVHIRNTHEESCREVALQIAELVKTKPNAVLGLATGSTPIKLYKELVRMENAGEIDLSQITTFNLDEYSGLAPDHPESYHYFMNLHLFGKLKNPPAPENINIPNGNLSDEDTILHCREYEQKIQNAGGIDIQILGIGGEGHIGFNEAGSSVFSGTRRVQLAARTINDAHEADNGFRTREEIPTTAVTMGVYTIRHFSKRVILLATGESKAPIIRRTVEGIPADDVPATLLKMHTGRRFGQVVDVFVDNGAASLLEHKELYVEADKQRANGKEEFGRFANSIRGRVGYVPGLGG